MKDNTSPIDEVSEELKKELIAISYATVPIQSDEMTQDQTNQVFIANVEKYFLPELTYELNGYLLNRDQYIEKFCKTLFLEAKFYEQVFTRAGDTIIVRGLIDFLCIVDGEKHVGHEDIYYDIFTHFNGKWLMLATFSHPK